MFFVKKTNKQPPPKKKQNQTKNKQEKCKTPKNPNQSLCKVIKGVNGTSSVLSPVLWELELDVH